MDAVCGQSLDVEYTTTEGPAAANRSNKRKTRKLCSSEKKLIASLVLDEPLAVPEKVRVVGRVFTAFLIVEKRELK